MRPVRGAGTRTGVGSGVGVGIGVGDGVAVGDGVGVGTAVGAGDGAAEVAVAWAIRDGTGLGPGLARVVATRVTRIADVAINPTTPTVAFRLNAVAPPSSCPAFVRLDRMVDSVRGLAEDTGGSPGWRSAGKRPVMAVRRLAR
jgi:hypothetical protein